MSVEAISWALKQQVASVHAKCVLLVLSNYANENNMCWPSQETIAAQGSMSTSSVKRAIKWLVENDFLSTERQRHGSHLVSNQYILNLERSGQQTVLFKDKSLEVRETSRDLPSRGQERNSLEVRQTPYPKGGLEGPKGPPIPEPSTTDSVGVGESQQDVKVNGPTSKPTRLSPEFWPDEDNFQLAVKVFPTMDINYETKQFISHNISKGLTSFHWLEAWKEYIRRSDRNYKAWSQDLSNSSKQLTEQEFWRLEPHEKQAAVESGRFVLPY